MLNNNQQAANPSSRAAINGIDPIGAGPPSATGMSSNSSRRGAPQIPGLSGTPVTGSEASSGFGAGGP